VSVLILRADARALPLADNSVDLIVTSPPYFALRSYTDGGAHYAGQVGSEPTPAAFVDALIECTREMIRVLKPSGSIWVNLGDKYDSGTATARVNPGTVKDGKGQGWHQGTPRYTAGRPKSLMGLPWRYALRCIDDLGLILRAEVIWSKPNSLPESVTDRVRRSHEQWFHFVTQPRYYSAVDRIREPQVFPRDINRPRKGYIFNTDAPGSYGNTSGGNPLGALPGSVRSVPTQPLKVPDHLGVDHFAAFPMEWPRWIIQGWSPESICTACGEPRRPEVQRTAMVVRPTPRRLAAQANGNAGRTATGGTVLVPPSARIVGEVCSSSCDATAPTRPAVVLDPFGGTGTTATVATALGRTGISVDLSSDYCRLARWRTSDPGQLAAAAQVEKPAPELEGQDTLFALDTFG